MTLALYNSLQLWHHRFLSMMQWHVMYVIDKHQKQFAAQVSTTKQHITDRFTCNHGFVRQISMIMNTTTISSCSNVYRRTWDCSSNPPSYITSDKSVSINTLLFLLCLTSGLNKHPKSAWKTGYHAFIQGLSDLNVGTTNRCAHQRQTGTTERGTLW